MEMIGQHDHRLDRERMTSARLAQGITQVSDVLCQQPQPPLRQIDGKEEAPPSNEVTALVGHAGLLT